MKPPQAATSCGGLRYLQILQPGKEVFMKTIPRLILILTLAARPACTAPPDETEAERQSRINGITVGSAIVVATIAFFAVQMVEGLNDLNDD
jgi:hypothetical protein